MVRTVAKRKKGGLTDSALLDKVRQWAALDSQVKLIEPRKKGLRDWILNTVESYGYEDDKGNGWIDLPESVDGIVAIQRQKRVGQTINEERAETLLKKKGIYKECTTTIVVLDEDAIRKAVFTGKISQEELDSLVDSKVTYALVPTKE